MRLADSSTANAENINPQSYDAKSLAAAIEKHFSSAVSPSANEESRFDLAFILTQPEAVSYTHLDVYKRQVSGASGYRVV